MKIILLLLCITAMQTCKEKPPEPPDTPLYKRNIFLSVEDTSVTEITLKVTIPESVKNREYIVKRDGQTLFTNVLTYSDTLLLDTALIPRRNYTYKAYRIKNNKAIDSSTIAYATTMDTTSHEFTFVFDTLGEGGSNMLNDVAVINENDIWAVGQIFLRDSVGQIDPSSYTTAHWNGESWELKRYYYWYQGNKYLLSHIRGVQLFNTSDIWFAAGSVFHWNGDSIQPHLLRLTILTGQESVEKLWGTSSSDLWGVGNYGTIVHYDGNHWSKIPSGTILPINDIWGAKNKSTGEQEILCVASNTSQNYGSKLLRIMNNTVQEIPDSGLSWSIAGVYFLTNKNYFVVGEGLFFKKEIKSSDAWKDIRFGLTNYYMTKIRGTSENNIIVVGAFGNFLHFNGLHWKNLHEQTYLSNGTLGMVTVKNNFVVAVGQNNSKAIILRGYK